MIMSHASNVMPSPTQVDGQDMRLSVVAAKRLAGSGANGGGAASLYLVVRILAPPAGGRTELAAFLQNTTQACPSVRLRAHWDDRSDPA